MIEEILKNFNRPFIESSKDLDVKDWVMNRKNGIGGSEAITACGMNPYKDRMTMYAEKLGFYDDEFIERAELEEKAKNGDLESKIIVRNSNQPAYFGNVLEQIVANELELDLNHSVFTENVYLVDPKVIFYHPTDTFMFANVDRLIVSKDTNQVLGGTEIKTSQDLSMKVWTEFKPSDQAYFQSQHYMYVLNLNVWFIAALIRGSEYRYYQVDRNEEFIECMRTLEIDLWTHVQEKKPPLINPDVMGNKALDDAKTTLEKLYPEIEKNEFVLDTENLLLNYANATASKALWTKEHTHLQNKIKAMIAKHKGAISNTHKIEWSISDDGTRRFGKVKEIL